MDKTVLIVEDNEKNMILEKDLLVVAGFKVLQAFNAKDGIELAKKTKPDVILMDVRLPDMRGTDAVKILRQFPETRDMPVIFVTASVMSEGLEEMKNISNTSFIGKPIDTRTFAQFVSNLINK